MKIYCSGIGGIGLSAYASLMAHSGHEVMGSDRAMSPLLEDLQSRGITIVLEQDGSQIPEDADLFVYSEAIAPDAPERKRAKELNITSYSYFQAVGEMSKEHTVVAVCGTHGKSSTTAMAAQVLTDAGLDPTVVVGTKVPFLENRNWRQGKGMVFLVEACEYKRSFHYLSPNYVLMLNVDADHFDVYSSEEECQQAYSEFLDLLPDDGVVITHGNDQDCMRIANESGKRVIDADTFELPKLGVPGKHMQENAQLVVALASELGIGHDSMHNSLQNFNGTWRRMEIKGDTAKGATVIDDYGHHPLEVRATLSALREAYIGRRLVCAFQPHTHDRTLKLQDEFATAFSAADIVVILDVFDARHFADTAKADIYAFTAAVEKGSTVDEVHYSGTIENTVLLLESTVLQPNDVLVCMGAGDVPKVSAALLS